MSTCWEPGRLDLSARQIKHTMHGTHRFDPLTEMCRCALTRDKLERHVEMVHDLIKQFTPEPPST